MSAVDTKDNKPVTKPYVEMKVTERGVAVVTFDVPDSKVNVLSEALMRDFEPILKELSQSKNLKGAVFTSGKADNFIAGADITAIKNLQKQSPIEAYEGSRLGKAIFEKLEKLPFRTVAAINGQCLGGGTEMTLACKYRIATDSKSTKIGFPEVMLGFIPGWGGTVRAPKLIGLQNAMDLIMTGRTIDGKKAWKMGLVDEVTSNEQLLSRAEEVALGAGVRRYQPDAKTNVLRFFIDKTPIGRSVARKTAYKSVMKETKGNFPAPLEALKLLIKNFDRTDDKAYEAESQVFARLAVTQVSKNLVGIFFAQTESKKLPSKSSDVSIKTVGVLGAGVMGAGIAQAAAYSGYNVVLKDVEQKFVDKGVDTISKLFGTLAQRRKITEEERTKFMSAIKPTIKYEDLSDCDLVIEAVIEDIQVKQQALREIENVIKKPFIFATNTSSLSVDELAQAAKEPAKVVGIHFFNPVHKMPLVEIIKGKATSDETLSTAKEFAMKLGKTTVTTGDAPGFVVNRILAPYLRESVILLEQGVPPESIEKAATAFGFPMGPFTLMDEVGLDVGAKVTHVLHEGLGDRMAPPKLMSQLESHKLLGKKGGKGFYLYDENGKKKIDPETKKAVFNPGVLAAISSPSLPMVQGAIQDRLVMIMLNEAARCLEENVVSDPSQLDLALIFGIGFPPFRGGILRYADYLGIKIVHQKLAFLSKVAGENYVPCRLILEMVAAEQDFYDD